MYSFTLQTFTNLSSKSAMPSKTQRELRCKAPQLSLSFSYRYGERDNIDGLGAATGSV